MEKKSIFLKLSRAGSTIGPFSVYDQNNNLIESSVYKSELTNGKVLLVNDDVVSITLVSEGKCSTSKTVFIKDLLYSEYHKLKLVTTKNACLWRHLSNPALYNSFYGNIEPYIIEYPFAYKYQDEILQNVIDYTKVYKYLNNDFGIFDNNAKVETDDLWFNKAIVYNGQQSSGILKLVPKPKNNLFEYNKYPKYNLDSKTITFTKSDNMYQYNNFWSVIKDKSLPLFLNSCESFSIDKVVNQINMDYSSRAFRKEPLRAKELRIRHILDDKSNVNLVSQFIYSPSQISYK